jgi:hypothetical protein
MSFRENRAAIYLSSAEAESVMQMPYRLVSTMDEVGLPRDRWRRKDAVDSFDSPQALPGTSFQTLSRFKRTRRTLPDCCLERGARQN